MFPSQQTEGNMHHPVAGTVWVDLDLILLENYVTECEEKLWGFKRHSQFIISTLWLQLKLKLSVWFFNWQAFPLPHFQVMIVTYFIPLNSNPNKTFSKLIWSWCFILAMESSQSNQNCFQFFPKHMKRNAFFRFDKSSIPWFQKQSRMI